MRSSLAVVPSLLVLCGCSASTATDVETPSRADGLARNVLVVVLDDIGYEILSQYGVPDPTDTCLGRPPTPALDALAASGVTFLNAWATPHCSPTRASLLTGRLPYRTGLGFIVDPCSAVTAGTEFELQPGEVTIPEALRSAGAQGLAPLLGSGVATAAVGKWHLGPDPVAPLSQGFDRFRGTQSNIARCDRPNETLCAWWKNTDGVIAPATEYAMTDTIDEALAFTADHADDPWFLYVALHAGHEPFHVPPAHLRPGYFQDDGFGGVVHPELAGCTPPQPDCPPLTAPVADCLAGCPLPVDRTDLERSQAMRPYYEAMVQATDMELGRLLSTIDLATTLVVVISDNGTPGEVATPPLLGDRSAGIQSRSKGTLYEGGVKVPLIVAGAGVAAPNRTTDAMVHVVDVFATVLEAVGVDAAELPLVSPPDLDSRSFRDVLRARTDVGRATLFTERFQPSFPQSLDPCLLSLSRAIRDERFKLIDRPDPADCMGPRIEELFDLAADPYEEHDLIPTGAHLSPGVTRDRYLALRAELDLVPLP